MYNELSMCVLEAQPRSVRILLRTIFNNIIAFLSRPIQKGKVCLHHRIKMECVEEQILTE